MLLRRFSWVLVFLYSRVLGAGDTYSPLFVIERSVNKNVVHYDARLRPDGSLDTADPIVAYWIMGARDGHRQDLNMLERTRAYGFQSTPSNVTGAVQIKLVSDRARTIVVRATPHGVRAETNISGHRAYLRRIFVTTHRSLMLDIPDRAELFGEDVETGEVRSEVVSAKF